jgi:hypothetical protein
MIIYGKMTYLSFVGEMGTFDKISVKPTLYETEYPIWIPDNLPYTKVFSVDEDWDTVAKIAE